LRCKILPLEKRFFVTRVLYRFSYSLNANIVLRTGANIARPGVPPGNPLSVPRYKEKSEKDIFVLMHLSPLCHHVRQAKGEKTFCLKFS